MFFTGFFVAGLVWSLLMALVARQGRKVLGPQLTHGLTLAGGRQLGILAA